MSASGESSTTMHRLLHASGSHPIPPPNDPKTNQYNQDLGLIHSTNGNHLESSNEGSSIDHQVVSHRFTKLQVMCSGGTVDNQLREAFCVKSIPVAEYISRNVYQSQSIPVALYTSYEYTSPNVYQSRIYQSKCIPVASHEEALLEFFTNGSVREYGVVFSTIRGTTVEISKSLFATAFDLPTEGLTDLSDVPKDKIFDARSLFSASKEQVSVSCFKKEMKIEYRLLHDILAKTIFVKAGSFDAVTRDRFLLMTAITFDVKVNWGSLLFSVLKAMVTPGSRQAKGFAIQIGVLLQNVQGLMLGESKGFPKSRILDAKTVHRFVHINEKVGLHESAASPRVKKTPVKKEVSKKRQAVGVEDAPIVKKKRTTKGKPVVIAQEAVPPKIDDATTDAPVEQLSVPKRKSQKRKRKLVLEDAIEVDEPVPAFVEQPAVVPVVEGTTEDPDAVIEQILHQLDTIGATDGGEHPAPTTKESIPWFDLPVFLARHEAEGFVGSSSDTDEELIADQPTVHLVPDAGDQPHVSETVAEGTTDDELLSIEEHQARIPFNASLPSTLAPTITPIRFGQGIEFREVYAYKASIPQIDASDKGNGILVEDDVQGHPAREICSLICTDIEFLIALREKVIEDVSIFVSSFSLRKLATLQSEDIFAKEGQVISWQRQTRVLFPFSGGDSSLLNIENCFSASLLMPGGRILSQVRPLQRLI
ncbi:hypothetical protein F511_39500 [Dorcoceras hygrometricum]|uniref:Dystroglycan-like n=1 Tax=Dorcoceras hygrometricum TaxID=472368 RepID=A0A2Z7B1Z8_9LAMI|nr:hypothetical protein F511_39500 [Dorcoceras hygrometricum]